MIQQLKEDQCLSTCTWKSNPFFKTQPEGPIAHYGIKWYEYYFRIDNTFPQLHDSPMVPEDLRCLSSCFDKYQQGSDLLTKIQQICSANGIDRQVPTHLEKGTQMVESNFSKIFANDCSQQPCLAARIFNPNLDCLAYYESKERTECSTNGVCNFVPSNRRDIGKFQGAQNERNLFGTSSFEIFSNTKKYTDQILRSFSPSSRAIKLCALAKLIQWYREDGDKYYTGQQPPTIFTKSETHGLFSSEAPTCDNFMPDIFGSLCNCVGTCAPPGYNATSSYTSNLIWHFETDNGLWECQDVCRQTSQCEFWTHSSFSSYFPRSNFDIFHCFLWRSCDIFSFSKENVIPGTLKQSVPAVSEHWSGPKDCSKYQMACPVVDRGEGYEVHINADMLLVVLAIQIISMAF